MVLHQGDPLPAWNDSPSKRAIHRFVDRVTREGSPEFIPVAELIAAFDNDGTLWVEKPLYVQGYFALDRIRSLVDGHPELREHPGLFRKTYGVPRENIMGSSLEYEYRSRGGAWSLMRVGEMNKLDDGEGKPESIALHIGRRPVIVAGNSDGGL